MKIEKKHIILAGVVTGGLVALYYGIKFFKNMQVEKALEDDVNTGTTQPSNKTATGTKVVPTSGGSVTTVTVTIKTGDKLYAAKDITVKDVYSNIYNFKKGDLVGTFQSRSDNASGDVFYRLLVYNNKHNIQSNALGSVMDNWVYTK